MELGLELRRAVLGCCCGTDHRRVAAIARACLSLPMG